MKEEACVVVVVVVVASGRGRRRRGSGSVKVKEMDRAWFTQAQSRAEEKKGQK
jgi:hypothetical protein